MWTKTDKVSKLPACLTSPGSADRPNEVVCSLLSNQTRDELTVDLGEFCTHALKDDTTAKKLMAINEALKKIGKKDWHAKHKEKPAKCDDRCPL